MTSLDVIRCNGFSKCDLYPVCSNPLTCPVSKTIHVHQRCICLPANFDQITLHLLSAATRHATHPAGPQQLSTCTSLQHLHGKHVGCLACKAHYCARHTSMQGIRSFTLVHLPHCACSNLSPEVQHAAALK